LVGFPVLTRAYDNNGRCPRQKLVFGILQLDLKILQWTGIQSHFVKDVNIVAAMQGRASIPQSQWCISPCFRFPPPLRIFQSLWKIFKLFPKNVYFIRQNFWWPFSLTLIL